jgi:O-methyltransferase domain
MGQRLGSVISCVAKLGIPDLLEAGSKTADELASQIGAHPGALYRLMRTASSAGVLAEGADGKFSQTPMSAVLRSNATPSLRGFAIMENMELMTRGWEQLEHSVRTGKTAVDAVYGKPVFQYFAEHPEAARIFNEGMTALSTIDSAPVAGAYPFEGIHSIVDVAGGHGLLLATILQRHPQMKGTLYEMASVIEGAAKGPLAPVMDRCTLVTGDMFTAMPAGHDAYIMKHIIHDWPDEVCVKILKGCRKGVNAGGKLLVADSVIKPGNDPDVGKIMDLEMLLFPGGYERTEQQFRDLFAASGWRLNRIIPTPSPVSIVEGVPA